MKQFVVDAFGEGLFTGNPAAVCILEGPTGHETMQAIAAENALSETAFVDLTTAQPTIRWFTPAVEVQMCGHATLAAGHVLLNELGFSESGRVSFASNSAVIPVELAGHRMRMELPAAPGIPHDGAVPSGAPALKWRDRTVHGRDLLLWADSREELAAIDGSEEWISALDYEIVVVASGPHADNKLFCRAFAPRIGIVEDPATGYAHTMMVPIAALKSGRSKFVSRQLSRRGGWFECEDLPEQGSVALIGTCRTFSRGEIEV